MTGAKLKKGNSDLSSKLFNLIKKAKLYTSQFLSLLNKKFWMTYSANAILIIKPNKIMTSWEKLVNQFTSFNFNNS